MSESFQRTQIVVLGMHRSGTSATTGLLGACGAYIGSARELTKPGIENPKGFFERRDARAICDALLHSAGADWWKVREFDIDQIPPAALTEQERKIRALVAELDSHGIWALKEPRIGVLLPVFRRLLSRPVAVFVVRHPVEVAKSLRRRNGFTRSAALALWEAYVVAALRHSADMPRVFLSYADLVRDPAATTRRLKQELERLGVIGLRDVDPGEVIDPALHRERVSNADQDSLLSIEQRRLWQSLARGRAPDTGHLSLSGAARFILEDFETDQRDALARAQKQADASRRFKEAEARLAEATAEFEKLTGSLKEREAHAAELAASLKEREAHAAELAARLMGGETQAAELVSRLTKAEAHADELAVKLDAARIEAGELAAEVKRQEEHAGELAAGLEAARTEAGKLTAEAKKQEAHAGEVSAALATAQTEIAELRKKQAADIAALAAKLKAREAEEKTLAAKLKKEESLSAERRARAKLREREIRNLKRSVSWRATAPLRALSNGLRWIERTVRPTAKAFQPAVKPAQETRSQSDDSYLKKAIAHAESAYTANDWKEFEARWQAILDSIEQDGPCANSTLGPPMLIGRRHADALAQRAKLNISVAQRLNHIDKYKHRIDDYVAAYADRTWDRGNKKRYVIYTAISRNYDSLKLPDVLDPRFDYVLFTDAPTPDTKIYQIRPITYFHENATRAARFVKTHPHVLLRDYDVAIWIDANIMILGDIYPLVKEFLASEKLLAAVPHPDRNTVYQEMDVCIERKKDDLEPMKEQTDYYRQSNFDGRTLIESNLMMFKLKEPKLESLLDAWWAQIDRYSRRDQLSLPYAISRAGIPWHPLTTPPNSVRNHSLFALVPHDAGGSSAGRLVEALQAPLTDPYAGHSYASLRDQRIAAQRNRKIDVVVCVHNAFKEVKDCLESISRARKSEHQRLIIVDDGSDEPVAQFLKGFAEKATWIELHRNDDAHGYTKAANQGLRAATGELIILLNSDTVVTDSWAEKMADAVFSTPGAGIVGPMSNAASYQSIPDHRGTAENTAINSLPPGITAEDMNRYCEKWTVSDVLPRVPLVHGFCFGITRAVIEKVGFFDEVNFPRGYGEENDYCFRVSYTGFGLVIATHTYVFHAKSASYPNAMRMELMKAGSEAFRRAHGRARVDRAVRSMQNNPILKNMRESAWTVHNTSLGSRLNSVEPAAV